MPLEENHQHPDLTERFLALSGPSLAVEPGHLPARGDLAHIKLAGRFFVPHYAVPMLHRTRADTMLLAQGNPDAEVVAALPAGALFEVLDMAGAYTWGQVENDGLVGYVAHAALEPVT